MRTVTTTTNVFHLNELSEAAKKVAINKERESYCEDCLCLDMKNEAEHELGITSDPINLFKLNVWYDLGYSQGDGVSFDCDNLQKIKEVNDLIISSLSEDERKSYDKLVHSLDIRVFSKHLGNYSFASASDINCDIPYCGENEEDLNVAEKVNDIVAKWYLEVCKKLKAIGYSLIEDDEQMEENIEANDYEFTENGEMFLS